MKNSRQRLPKIAFVILAGGESKRMGNIKQLIQWRNKSLIEHLVHKSIKSLAADTFLVLGANAHKIAFALEAESVQLIYNTDWRKGIGSSIAVAVGQIQKQQKDYTGILFSLVDQPLISTSHFNKLIGEFALGEKGIVATSNRGNIVVPAIFSCRYFENLIHLDGSKGAKSLIVANIHDTASVACNDHYIDIDTPQDLEEFLKQHP